MNPLPDFQVLPGPSEGVLERIQQALMGLTRSHRVTKKELIRCHLTEIDAAHGRGVSYAEIARTLTAAGCTVSPRLLRKYLDDIRRKVAHQQEATMQPLAVPIEVPAEHPMVSMPLTLTDARPAPPKTRSLRRSIQISTRKDTKNGR